MKGMLSSEPEDYQDLIYLPAKVCNPYGLCGPMRCYRDCSVGGCAEPIADIPRHHDDDGE